MKPANVILPIVFIGALLMIYFRHMLLQGQHKIVIIRQESCECATTSMTEVPTEIVRDIPLPTTDWVPADKPILLPTFLLIIVPMRPDSFTVRELIRNTWFSGYENSSDVLLRFLVGTKNLSTETMKLLKREHSQHGDIAFIDLAENYKALTNKTMAMLKWSHEHVNYSYLMKCDDDTFVYIDLLVRELRRRPKTTGLYYGRIERNSPVIKDPEVAWYDPDWNLTATTYLPYAIGGGYILSWDLVGTLAHQVSYLKWHLNEDTAVGSWLAPYEYERRSDHLFCVTGEGGKYKHRCSHPPLFHVFYSYPGNETQTTYFKYLHSQHVLTKSKTAPTVMRPTGIH